MSLVGQGRIGSAAVALAMVAGACGTPNGGRPQEENTSPQESVSTVRAQESVDVLRGEIAGYEPLRARYDVDAELAPAQGGTVDECEAAAPGETGAARFQVKLHHTHDPGSSESKDVRKPQVSAAPVGASTLQWVRPGGGCTQTEQAPHQYFQSGWNHLDVVTLEGYLFGVDPDAPSGDGLELRLEDHDDLADGAEPVTVDLVY